MSNDPRVFELVVYRLGDETTQEQFRAAYDELSAWLVQRPGFVSRELLKADDGDRWIELVWWTNLRDAKAAAADAETAPECAPFFAVVDLPSTTLLYAESAGPVVRAAA